MALEEFWTSVRMAANRLVTKVAVVDSPRLDQQRIESLLRGATFWLTPESIKGYDSNDIDFLAEDEKTRLQEGVEEFKPVAASVPRNDSPTEEQVDAGVSGFRKILEVIRPDKYADFDAFVIGKKIENQVRAELPDWVREMVFEMDIDSTGAPALWIWVEVEDYVAEDQTSLFGFRQVREILRRAAAVVCPDRWPYIRLRTVSEQRQPAETNRR